MTNAEFAKSDKNFLSACELAQALPTQRQASKFRNKKGKAYNEQRLHGQKEIHPGHK